MTQQPVDGQWYQASDSNWYCWPDPTPFALPPTPAGVQWASSAAAPEVPARNKSPLAIGMFCAAAALVIGSFLPWITVRAALIGQVSKSGMDGGDGFVTLAAGGLAAWFSLGQMNGWSVPNSQRILLWLAGIAALLIALYDFVDVSDRVAGVSGSSFAQANVGSGLYLCLAGSVTLLVCNARWPR